MTRIPGSTLQRIAAWIAPAATYERVLLPLIADLQFEHARARTSWQRAQALRRGLAAFWFSLGAAAVRTLALGSTTDEVDATHRRFVHAGWATSAFIVLLVLYDVQAMRELGAVHVFALPSVLGLALSLGVLFATALSRRPTARVQKRAVGRLAASAGLLTFLLAAWLTPLANQEYRERAFQMVTGNAGRVPLKRGDRELTLGQLTSRAAELRRSGTMTEVARLEVEWHKKPALSVACLAFALLGASIAATHWRRVWRGLSAFVLGLGYYFALMEAERAADAGQLAPFLAMWAPVAVLAAYGALLAALTRRETAPPATEAAP